MKVFLSAFPFYLHCYITIIISLCSAIPNTENISRTSEVLGNREVYGSKCLTDQRIFFNSTFYQ